MGPIIDTPSETHRVARVRAAALRLAVRHLLGRELTEEQAADLATRATLEEVLKRLRRRFQFRRVARGAKPDKSFDQAIAVHEVISSLTKKDGHAVPPEVKKAIDRRVQAAGEEEQLRGSIRQTEQLLKSHREYSRRLRQFLRNVDRLRRKQVQQIHVALADDRKRNETIEKLDKIYYGYIQKAIHLDTSQEG